MANYLSLHISRTRLAYGVSDQSIDLKASGVIPLDNQADDFNTALTQALGGLTSEIPETVEECSVSLSSEFVFFRELNLPYSEAQVHKTIRFDIEEFIPYDIEEAAVSYDILESGDACRVLATTCRADLVSSIISALNEIDLDPKVIEADIVSALNYHTYLSGPSVETGNLLLVSLCPDTTGVCLIKEGRLKGLRAVRKSLWSDEQNNGETIAAVKRSVLQSAMLMSAGSDTVFQIAGPESGALPLKQELENDLAGGGREGASSDTVPEDSLVILPDTVPEDSDPEEKEDAAPEDQPEKGSVGGVYLAPDMVSEDFVLKGALVPLVTSPWLDLNYRRDNFEYKGVWEKLFPPLTVLSAIVLVLFIILNVYAFGKITSLNTSIATIQNGIREKYSETFEVPRDSVPLDPDALKKRLESKIIELKQALGEDPALPDIIPVTMLLTGFYDMIPDELDLDITHFNIGQNEISVTGTLPEISDIDKLLEVYKKGSLFSGARTTGQINLTKDGRRTFTMRLNVVHTNKGR